MCAHSRAALSKGTVGERSLILFCAYVCVMCADGGWFANRARQASDLRDQQEQQQLVENEEQQPEEQQPEAAEPQQQQPLDGIEEVPADVLQKVVQRQQQQHDQAMREQASQQQPVVASSTAAASKAGCVSGAPPTGTFALGFRAKQWVELAASEDARLNSRELSVSAWVRLAPSDFYVGESASIQTIVATKASGCEPDAAHQGISLFVNAWNTDSGQLFLSWGNSKSGCEELATARHLVEPSKWAFVAATIDAHGDAALYVNGVLQAHSSRVPAIGERRIVSASSPIDRGNRGAQQMVRIGAHADGTHALRGHLASVAIHPVALDEAALRRLMCGAHAALEPPPLALLAPTLRPKSKDGSKLDRVQPGGGGGERMLQSIRLDDISAPAGMLRLHLESDVINSLTDRQPSVSPVDKLSSLSRSSDPAIGGAIALLGGRGGGSGKNEPAPNGWPLGWLPAKPMFRPDAAAINASDVLAYERRKQVKGVMQRAWSAYRKYAWGADELKPVSNRSHDWLRLGATMVDCLDNLWIMGMRDEFREAREWVATRLSFSTPRSISMFETVIRILGGLLSAYELSKDRIFLTKGEELADKMMYAFEQRSRIGLPCTTISLVSSSCSFASWTGQSAVLAEFGTIQLEFKYLAYHTGKRKYWDVAQRIMNHLQHVDKPHGLYPVFMSPGSGSWTSQKITLGALGDSFYEYLIKQWLITNKKETYLREMFDSAMLAIASKLVQRSSPSGYVYIADWQGSSLSHKMDHLACFAGAMYAVGAQDNGKYDAEYMTLAEALSETCYKMYSNTATGLSPEFVQFISGRDMVTPRTASYNIGRPEAAEAWFYMWYYTRDPKWREMGWKVFEAFERHAATGSGWTALPDVDNPTRKRDDKMESFVLAETVKYLYLLFDPDYPVPLEKYVFNTEAHPLGRFEAMI